MSTSAFEIPDKRLFRPDEVAKIFEVSLRTVQRWCECGRLESFRLGPRKIKIERECLIKFISIDE